MNSFWNIIIIYFPNTIPASLIPYFRKFDRLSIILNIFNAILTYNDIEGSLTTEKYIINMK